MKLKYFFFSAFLILAIISGNCQDNRFPSPSNTSLDYQIDLNRPLTLTDPEEHKVYPVFSAINNDPLLKLRNIIKDSTSTKTFTFYTMTPAGNPGAIIELIPAPADLTRFEELLAKPDPGNLLDAFTGYYIKEDLDGENWKWTVLRNGNLDEIGRDESGILTFDTACEVQYVRIWTQFCNYKPKEDGSIQTECSAFRQVNRLRIKDCDLVPSDIYGIVDEHK